MKVDKQIHFKDFPNIVKNDTVWVILHQLLEYKTAIITGENVIMDKNDNLRSVYN